MAQYSRTVLTDAGVILARRMMDETITMEFTRIVTGDGQYSSGEDIAARTALKSQKQSFPLSSRSLTDEDRVLHLKYVISNVNPDSSPLTVGYYVREVGIYAHVTGESEILYAVAIADADAADYLPEYDELQPSTITMDWFITVGNTENITIQASPSAYALAEDLADLVDVVDQKLDADGDSENNTVTFTSSDMADSAVTKNTGWETVAPLESGETHESFMTKFSKMIKNLRWIYKLLGTTDISSIGNGTVTGGLSSLNSSLEWMQITDGITDGIRAYRWGKVVFMSFEGVTLTRNVSANNPFSSVPMSYVPAYSVSFKDSLSNKRIVIEHVTGYIFCTEALTSGTNLRGFVTYLTN